MNEIERATDIRGDLLVSQPRLVDRALDLTAAHQIGTALASTSFAPQAFRGKPDEAAAAIMFGDEIGLSPMQSLRSIYVIGGTPALYSRAMVALVLGAGHAIWTVAEEPGKVTVAGRRRGSSHVEEVTWTTARATTAGYTSNKKYATDSAAMLYARAAGDVARRIAPDVLLGLAYSVEEIELSEPETSTVSRTVNTDEAKPRVRRKAVPPPASEPDFDDDPSSQTPAAAEPPPAPDAPELPPDPTPAAPRESARAAAVAPTPAAAGPARDEPPLDEGGVTPTGDRPGYITKAQLRMLHALLREAGLGNDREAALAFCSKHGGRPVESSKDLTRLEFERVRVALVELADGVHDAELIEDVPDPDEFADG